MDNEFVTYEQALGVRELGFDEPCFGWFTHGFLRIGNVESKHVQGEGELLAPLKQQVFRWFREKYQLRGFIGWRPNTKKWDYHVVNMTLDVIEYVKERGFDKFNTDHIFNTYEEAESNCINKLIEIVKNEKI